MQIQPYPPPNPAESPGGRIVVSSPYHPEPTAAHRPAEPPTLLTVFGREIGKRKGLLLTWAIATAIVAAAIVFLFARPLYRAEGKLAYIPNYNVLKPLYNPPNIQTAVQILRDPEVLERVRAGHLPGASKANFLNSVRVEIAKQSQFIEYSFDWPDRDVAETVANALLQESAAHFETARQVALRERVTQVQQDLQVADADLRAAKADYEKAHRAKGVTDLAGDIVTTRSAVADLEGQLRRAKDRRTVIKAEIKFLEGQRDAPPDAADPTIDETFFPLVQAMVAELQTKLTHQQSQDAARINLKFAQAEEERLRPLVAKGIWPRSEYDKVLAQIQVYEATVKQSEEIKRITAELERKYAELKKKAGGGRPARRAVVEDLTRLQKEEALLPVTVVGLETELKEKRAALDGLLDVQRDVAPLEESITLVRARMVEYAAQLSNAQRGRDQNAGDLKIAATATADDAPYSSNAAKLGLGVVGASALLFLGYIALFALPQLASAPVASARIDDRPRAIVALVPVTNSNGPPAPSANGPPASLPPPLVAADVSRPSVVALAPHANPPAADPVMALAQRITEGGSDRGGIVLFTPTADHLSVAPVIGDLGQHFSQQGKRVLVFDARPAAETPTWAGPQTAGVSAAIEGYLGGGSDASSTCFAPTTINGVEYSQADLSTNLSGVMAAHRFRQLVEEMRERYSLVLMVSPPVTMNCGDALLGTLAEGMVLVVESGAAQPELHTLLQTLRDQYSATLYGTLAVPKA